MGQVAVNSFGFRNYTRFTAHPLLELSCSNLEYSRILRPSNGFKISSVILTSCYYPSINIITRLYIVIWHSGIDSIEWMRPTHIFSFSSKSPVKGPFSQVYEISKSILYHWFRHKQSIIHVFSYIMIDLCRDIGHLLSLSANKILRFSLLVGFSP